jgi:signal transduction histidine kinase/CheY-like chemotaxis protein
MVKISLLATAASSDKISERTEVLHGKQNVINTVLQFTSNAKSRIDACVDYSRPSLAIEIEQLEKAFLDAKSRGVKLRYGTEVTENNIGYCKQLIKMVNELRHIEGIKGNFYISETEYIAPASLHRNGESATQIIYTNVKEIVEHQQQYVFDSFWSRAIPAERRIREIEEGIVQYETKVLENKEQIFSHLKSVIENASERSVCSSIGGMQLVYNNFFDEYKKIIHRHRHRKRGEGKGVRWIISINKDSIDLVKLFLDTGVQIRHVKNLTPMNFAVDNRHFHATIDKMETGKIMESLLTSNEPAYISHYNSIFEHLWKNGSDAVERIKEIEEGVDLADIEVIPSSARAQGIYLDIVNAAKEEILWIFPTTNAFFRQDKIGAIPVAIQAARERNVIVRILVPGNSLIEEKVQQLKQYCSDHITIDVRYIEQMSEIKATILVVDRKDSLVMELRDDSKTTFSKAIGLSTYSNSKAGVLSYVAIFENSWRQAELYEQLMKVHEQLKIHDKMQKEFIGIAAHELRNPIQPILGLAEIVKSKIKDAKQGELLDVIIRNAKRLQRLTEDILNVTKIESQSLDLKNEQFNLSDVITNAMNDIMINIDFLKKSQRNAIKLLYHQPQDILIQADKGRITQVIFNLLSNAVKATEEGTITVSLEKKEDNEHVVISVKDTGAGLDPGILPRLFTKFATKSFAGTGLGLYISKSIVEAHGGKIGAENNSDGRGATFAFSLPLIIQQDHRQESMAINTTGGATMIEDVEERISFHKTKMKRIFLVDDDYDHTITFKVGLELAGFEVDAYNDSAIALSTFKPDYYALLLIDIKMPKIDGLELYARIRKIDDKVKVWFITAYEVYYKTLKEVSSISKEETILDRFIQKPIEINNLVKQVKSELD